jgi:ribonuclease T1
MNLRWMSNFCGARILPLFAVSLFVSLALATTPASAYRQHSYNDLAIQEIALSSLPVEARETLRLAKQGGPFPYPRDGVVFGNFEKRLPKKQRGYYHEYTVKTPGIHSRGARRIVCGQSFECYYSDDHYKTFKLIRE